MEKAKETFNRHTTCKTHNDARLKCDDFMNQRTNVARKIDAISKEEEKRYEIRLTSFLDVASFLIMQSDASLDMMSPLLPTTRVHSKRWLIGTKIKLRLYC